MATAKKRNRVKEIAIDLEKRVSLRGIVFERFFYNQVIQVRSLTNSYSMLFDNLDSSVSFAKFAVFFCSNYWEFT